MKRNDFLEKLNEQKDTIEALRASLLAAERDIAILSSGREFMHEYETLKADLLAAEKARDEWMTRAFTWKVRGASADVEGGG